jgi:hypothetical protein
VDWLLFSKVARFFFLRYVYGGNLSCSGYYVTSAVGNGVLLQNVCKFLAIRRSIFFGVLQSGGGGVGNFYQQFYRGFLSGTANTQQHLSSVAWKQHFEAYYGQGGGVDGGVSPFNAFSWKGGVSTAWGGGGSTDLDFGGCGGGASHQVLLWFRLQCFILMLGSG